jgi:hypothetical protein
MNEQQMNEQQMNEQQIKAQSQKPKAATSRSFLVEERPFRAA